MHISFGADSNTKKGMATAADMAGHTIVPCMWCSVKFMIFIKTATPGFRPVYMTVPTAGMTFGTVLFITLAGVFRNHIK